MTDPNPDPSAPAGTDEDVGADSSADRTPARNTERHLANARLRRAYIELERALLEANPDQTVVEVRRNSSELQRIANAFVADNLGLVHRKANKWAAGNAETRKDVGQECSSALWEKFLVWDPDRSTFPNFVEAELEGKARRQFNFLTSPLKYHDSSAKYAVDAAIAAMLEEAAQAGRIGYQPSDAEIAARAGVTVNQVAIARMPAPLRLDRPVGDEDGAVLADVLDLADTASGYELDDERAAALVADPQLTDREAYMLTRHCGLDGERSWIYSECEQFTYVGRERCREAVDRAQRKLDISL